MNEEMKDILKYINEEYFNPDGDEFDEINEAINYAVEAISKLQEISTILEPLKNYNAHNEILEKLKQII